MKLFEHPVYGKDIPWLCRLRLHFYYMIANFTFSGFSYYSYKCRRCGYEPTT